jgi:hypothetical protein
MSEPVQETGFCLPVQRHTYELSRRVRWVALVIRPKTAKYGPFPSTSSVRRAKRWGGSNIDFRNTICFLCVYGCWLCFLGVYYCLDCSSSLRRRRKVPSDYERRTTAWDRQFDEDKCSFEIRHSAAPLPLPRKEADHFVFRATCRNGHVLAV